MTITAEDLKKLPTPTDTTEAQSGKDTLLYLEAPGSSTETPKWTLVGGQRDCTLDMSSDSIDASHKTSGGWQTKLQGLKTWSITYTGLQVMNDDGAKIMEYAFMNGKPVHAKIVYPDKSYQQGWASVTKFKKGLAYKDAATIDATLEGQGEISEVTAGA